MQAVDGPNSSQLEWHQIGVKTKCAGYQNPAWYGFRGEGQESAKLVEGFVVALSAAFEDPEVDREAQGLDSMTLSLCAKACELVVRLRVAEGDGVAQAAAAGAAAALREAAVRLKREEDAESN
jgi:hypothetical protein